MSARLLRRGECFLVGHTWELDFLSGATSSFGYPSPVRKMCRRCNIRRLGDIHSRGLPGSTWFGPAVMVSTAVLGLMNAESSTARIAWIITTIYALTISAAIPVFMHVMNTMARDARHARDRSQYLERLLDIERASHRRPRNLGGNR